MDYTKELSNIRNKMHCDIVQEATVRIMVSNNTTDGVISLENPIEVGGYVVQSVCCESGLLISTEDRVVRYQDLTVEHLSVLHQSFVVGKKYTFISNKQFV
jgi:hypothetical protein